VCKIDGDEMGGLTGEIRIKSEGALLTTQLIRMLAIDSNAL
jgi:hypothetical protein